MSVAHGTMEAHRKEPTMNNIIIKKRPHKTSWTVKELAAEVSEAETKKRWTTTQMRVLMERITELEATVRQLNKEKSFLLTMLDKSKSEDASIRSAADMVGIRLPKTKKK